MGLGERFWAKVDKSDGCWVWTAAKFWDGYGAFSVVVDGKRYTRRAHRLAYEDRFGPIPDKLVLDHLCRNPACVRPEHLQIVSRRENTLRGDTAPAKNIRKTHCDNGHEFTEQNVYLWRGSRRCRACGRENARRYRAGARA